MFKRLIKKDKFLRKQYNRFEIWNKLNKSLDKSINLYNISEPFLLKKPKKYSKTPIRNYCFKTGRSYGVVPFFRISRMLVRKKAGIGLLLGVSKNN
jgi:ribosomal protein S14